MFNTDDIGAHAGFDYLSDDDDAAGDRGGGGTGEDPDPDYSLSSTVAVGIDPAYAGGGQTATMSISVLGDTQNNVHAEIQFSGPGVGVFGSILSVDGSFAVDHSSWPLVVIDASSLAVGSHTLSVNFGIYAQSEIYDPTGSQLTQFSELFSDEVEEGASSNGSKGWSVASMTPLTVSINDHLSGDTVHVGAEITYTITVESYGDQTSVSLHIEIDDNSTPDHVSFSAPTPISSTGWTAGTWSRTGGGTTRWYNNFTRSSMATEADTNISFKLTTNAVQNIKCLGSVTSLQHPVAATGNVVSGVIA